jgi:hypothetical protein
MNRKYYNQNNNQLHNQNNNLINNQNRNLINNQNNNQIYYQNNNQMNNQNNNQMNYLNNNQMNYLNNNQMNNQNNNQMNYLNNNQMNNQNNNQIYYQNSNLMNNQNNNQKNIQNNNQMNNHNNYQMNYQNNNQHLLSKIEDLKTKIKELEKEKNNIIKNYSEKNEQGQNKIKDLESQYSMLKNNNQLLEKKIKDLESQYSILKNNNQLLEKNNINLEQKLEQKEKSLNEKDKMLNNKEKEINTMIINNKKEMNQKNAVIEEYKNIIKENSDKLNRAEKEVKSLQEQSNQKNKEFNGAINTFEDMRNENIQLKKKLSEYQELEKKYNDIKNSNIRLNAILSESEIKDEFLQKKAEEYYDVVIDIDSINSLKKNGWQIIYNKERKEQYEKIIHERTMKIGVVGLNNVGKSYLLSKIVRVEIPTGYSVETKGISIKYAEEEKEQEGGLCILDSAGHEAPLLLPNFIEISKELINKNNLDNEKKLEEIIKRDEEEELSKDKANTERLIERLIISLSDMIILVIGKLTRTEQRLINRIKEESKNNEISKVSKIIVVHNLAQFHKIKEVEKHINTYLLLSATFNLEEMKAVGKGNRVFYVEKKNDKNENITVFHYIMAKEGTEAGDYYNNLTLELIKEQYNSFTKRENIDITQKIINIFSELSTEIIGERIDMEKIKIIENKIKLIDNQNSNTEQNTKFNFKNTYIDQDGKYLQNKEFEPKYSLYFYREGDDEDEDEYENFLLLRLEIPGNISKLTARSTDPKKEKYRGIVINIHKEEDEIPEKNKKDFQKISDNRKYGKYAYFIDLKKTLILHKKKAIGKTGIYQIKFNDNNKEKETLKEAPKEVANSLNNKEEVEGKMIASGIYVLKFMLTQDSYNN